MIHQQMIEVVQRLFPDTTDTEITSLLNQYLHEFYSETRVMRTHSDVTLNGSITYNLPSGIGTVLGYSVLDASDNPMTDRIYLQQDQERHVIFTDSDGNKLTSEPSGAAKLRVVGVAIPTDLSGLTDTPTMPVEFHMAPVARVIMIKAGLTERLPLAQFWAAEYKALERRAKIYGNTHSDGTDFVFTIDAY